MASPAKLSRFIFKVFFSVPRLIGLFLVGYYVGLRSSSPSFPCQRPQPQPQVAFSRRHAPVAPLAGKEGGDSTRRRGRRVLECFFVLVHCAWSFSSKFLAPTFDKLSYFTLWLKLRNICQTFLFFLRETAMSSCSPPTLFVRRSFSTSRVSPAAPSPAPTDRRREGKTLPTR